MGITITFKEVPEQEAGTTSWPLRVEVVSTEPDLESEVFVYHAKSNTATTDDICECVASVIQMYGISKDQPSEIDGLPVPFYRKSVAEFHFPDYDAAQEGKDTIIADLSLLLREHRAFESITSESTVILS